MFRMLAPAILVSLLGIGPAVAQGFCATRAIDKDGKPLAGAARTAFMKQCCEATALDKDGKPLEGALGPVTWKSAKVRFRRQKSADNAEWLLLTR
jgi:hypothetical protein